MLGDTVSPATEKRRPHQSIVLRVKKTPWSGCCSHGGMGNVEIAGAVAGVEDSAWKKEKMPPMGSLFLL